jgi:hypothetical protein
MYVLVFVCVPQAPSWHGARIMKRAMRVGLVVLGVLIVVLAVVAVGLPSLVRWSMTPSSAFDPAASPPEPDYADPTNWSALPDRDDAADAVPIGVSSVEQRFARADVFYVHPTTYIGSRWNAPTSAPSLAATTDRVATQIQATAFNGCCAVYAPRYRQTNGLPFTNPSKDGDRAVQVAYDDVRHAFAAFQRRRGAGRPFILAAHSQGAVLAERLLQDQISGTPLREQLVVAYLIGGRVTVAGLRAHTPDIEPCRTATQRHCVVAWNARGALYRSNAWEMALADPGPRLCTNPLSWRGDDQPAPASDNLGAVFMETSNRAPRPAFADGQCVAGVLQIRSIGDVPRDFMSRILDRIIGPANYHPIEYQLFFSNLRANAELRVSAMLASSP